MSEHTEQSMVIYWAERHADEYPELRWLHSSLNGIFIPASKATRSRIINRMKAEGMKRGIPDLFLPVARHGKHGIYLELKRNDGGVLSNEQKEFLAFADEQGYHAVVCNGCDEATEMLEWYLRKG
jgi:hypothetical protein